MILGRDDFVVRSAQRRNQSYQNIYLIVPGMMRLLKSYNRYVARLSVVSENDTRPCNGLKHDSSLENMGGMHWYVQELVVRSCLPVPPWMAENYDQPSTEC